MPSRRSYAEGCAAAHALDLVGERWALLVIRELLFSPKRFTDLDNRLTGASTSVLSQRLRELVEGGVVARVKLPLPAASWVYQLTDWGRELEPIILALGLWGCRSRRFGHELPVTPASMALALRAFADPAKVRDLPGPVELRLDEETFNAAPDDGHLRVTGPTGQPPTARIIAVPGDLRPFLHGQRATHDSLVHHNIRTEGDRAAAIALLDAVSG